MNEPVFRAATPADLSTVIALTRATFADHARRLPDHFPGETYPASEFLFSTLVAGKLPGPEFGGSFLILCELAGEVVGHILVVVSGESVDADRHDLTASVWDLSVRPDVRERGLGAQLLAEAMDRLRASGISLVRAQVWQGNTSSEALFLKAGFAPSAQIYALRLAPPLLGRIMIRAQSWWPFGWWFLAGMASLLALAQFSRFLP